jgi:ABC-2 type transport system ATP-binding protein
MLAPNLGSARLCGADPFFDAAIKRRLGLVPEQDPIYPRATGLETTAYLVRLHGFPAREAREIATRALDRVGLSDAMHREIRGYSKGMRQRAKLAQALAHDPDVLILDEPLNGLDPIGRREVTALVHELGDEGRCVVVSSHVLHEVEAMAKRVLLMDHGRVIADGTIHEIRRDLSDRPLAVVVRAKDPRAVAARLVGAPGVRRLDVEFESVSVLTTKPDDLFAEVARLVAEEGLAIDSFAPTDESLEAVFRYLTARS